MIIPDLNILIHAHNPKSSLHRKARAWWDAKLQGSEGVGLPWVVILGFIRITTHPRILEKPLRPDAATRRIDDWLALPQVHIPAPSARHFGLLKSSLDSLGTAGNLTTDAHLACLAMERGYLLCSTDADFARFPKLRWENPLQ